MARSLFRLNNIGFFRFDESRWLRYDTKQRIMWGWEYERLRLFDGCDYVACEYTEYYPFHDQFLAQKYLYSIVFVVNLTEQGYQTNKI